MPKDPTHAPPPSKAELVHPDAPAALSKRNLTQRGAAAAEMLAGKRPAGAASPLFVGTRRADVLSPVQAAYARNYAEGFSRAFQERLRRDLIDDWQAVIADASRGVEKAAVLDALGCRVVDGHVTAPTHAELVQNYLALLAKHGGDRTSNILPAVVLARGDGAAREFRFITPGVDAWPDEEGFRIHRADDEFRLPGEVVLQAMSEGRFPLLDAIHDVFHFVGLVDQPAFGGTLREASGRARVLATNRAKMAHFYTAEWLTLADPARLSELRALLAHPATRTSTDPIPFQSFVDCVESMSTIDLIGHARRLIADYGRMLTDFGGGVTRSQEKLTFTRYGITRNPVAPLVQFGRVDNYDNYSFTFTLGATPALLAELLRLREMPQAELEDLIGDSVVLAGCDYGRLASRDVALPVLLEKLIRVQVARMEFGAWESATRVDHRRWVRDLLAPTVDLGSPGVEFVMHTMGESSPLYRALVEDAEP